MRHIPIASQESTADEVCQGGSEYSSVQMDGQQE